MIILNQLYFNNEPIELHQIFKDIFSFDELKSIIDGASVLVDTEFDITVYSILISTKEYYFELSANIGECLDIYCYNNENHTEQKLQKDEFMNLYKSSLLEIMDCIILED